MLLAEVAVRGRTVLELLGIVGVQVALAVAAGTAGGAAVGNGAVLGLADVQELGFV